MPTTTFFCPDLLLLCTHQTGLTGNKGQNSHTFTDMSRSSKSHPTSERMMSAYASIMPPTSATPQVTLTQSSTQISDKTSKSPANLSYHDGANTASNLAAAIAGMYPGAATDSPAKAAVVASLAYARMQQEAGFPYGISGVAMTNYNYGNDLYNYVTNGFPRKSRICSYCAKVFTRSTTRRYHEKRCPLLRAAGSLAKGSTDTKNINASVAMTSGNGGDNSGTKHSSQPPPLIAVAENSSSSLLTLNSTSLTHATSANSFVAVAGSSPLNSSGLGAYGSPQVFIPKSTSTALSALIGSPKTNSANNEVDQNRNSVVVSIKQESELTGDARGDSAISGFNVHGNSPNRDLDTLRNKLTTQIYSPLSAASPSPSLGSPSVDGDGESDEVEDLSFHVSDYKPGTLVTSSSYPSENASHLKPFYLSDLKSSHLSQPLQDGSYKLIPGSEMPNNVPNFEPIQESPVRHSDEDEESVRDEEAYTIFQGEDDTEMECRVSGLNEVINTQGNICGLCSQEFETSFELHTHEQAHQKYKPHSCRFCGQRFLRISMRMAHERLHTVVFPWGCVVCGLRFARKFALRQHIRRRHLDPGASYTPFSCRYCKKTVTSVSHIYNHFHSHSVPRSESESLAYLHTSRRKSPSPVTGVATADLAPPPSVEIRISPDSPLVIKSESPALISMKSPLENHTSLLTPIKESTVMNGSIASSGHRDMEWCRLCEKEYPKSFMRYHERAHADQKPYECPTCKKRFGYKNNMKSHMKLHAGIKPYQCQICGAKFTRGSTLRRHARRHGINTDTIWDLFVSKGGHGSKSLIPSDRAYMLNPATTHDAGSNALSKGHVRGQGSLKDSSTAVTSVVSQNTKSDDTNIMVSTKRVDITASANGFDPRQYSPSPSLTQSLLSSYQAMPNASQALYQPYTGTSQFIGYGTSFSQSSTQAVQSDALNLSMPDKQRRHSTSPSALTHPPTPSSTIHTQGSSHQLSMSVDGRSSSGQCFTMLDGDINGEFASDVLHNGQNQGSNNGTLRDSGNWTEEVNTSDMKSLHSFRVVDRGVQVALGCTHIEQVCYNQSNDRKRVSSRMSPLDMSTSTSPPKSGPRLGEFKHESLASLMSSGLLFQCPFCDCYFTELAMYQIHQKYHQPNHPFTCTLCGENCHEKTYFSLHLLEHLR